MKLFDTLKNWQHTFTAWAAKQYQAFRGAEPELVALGDRVYPYVKQALLIGLSFESPAIAAAAGPIADAIHAKIDAAAALLYDFGPHPTVLSALQTAQADLASFEQTAGIKSAGAQNAISKALASFGAFVDAIRAATNAAAPAITAG